MYILFALFWIVSFGKQLRFEDLLIRVYLFLYSDKYHIYIL